MKIIEYQYVGAILNMEFPMTPWAKLRSVNISPKTEKDLKKIPATAKNREFLCHANVNEILEGNCVLGVKLA